MLVSSVSKAAAMGAKDGRSHAKPYRGSLIVGSKQEQGLSDNLTHLIPRLLREYVSHCIEYGNPPRLQHIHSQVASYIQPFQETVQVFLNADLKLALQAEEGSGLTPLSKAVINQFLPSFSQISRSTVSWPECELQRFLATLEGKQQKLREKAETVLEPSIYRQLCEMREQQSIILDQIKVLQVSIDALLEMISEFSLPPQQPMGASITVVHEDSATYGKTIIQHQAQLQEKIEQRNALENILILMRAEEKIFRAVFYPIDRPAPDLRVFADQTKSLLGFAKFAKETGVKLAKNLADQAKLQKAVNSTNEQLQELRKRKLLQERAILAAPMAWDQSTQRLLSYICISSQLPVEYWQQVSDSARILRSTRPDCLEEALWEPAAVTLTIVMGTPPNLCLVPDNNYYLQRDESANWHLQVENYAHDCLKIADGICAAATSNQAELLVINDFGLDPASLELLNEIDKKQARACMVRAFCCAAKKYQLNCKWVIGQDAFHVAQVLNETREIISDVAATSWCDVQAECGLEVAIGHQIHSMMGTVAYLHANQMINDALRQKSFLQWVQSWLNPQIQKKVLENMPVSTLAALLTAEFLNQKITMDALPMDFFQHMRKENALLLLKYMPHLEAFLTNNARKYLIAQTEDFLQWIECKKNKCENKPVEYAIKARKQELLQGLLEALRHLSGDERDFYGIRQCIQAAMLNPACDERSPLSPKLLSSQLFLSVPAKTKTHKFLQSLLEETQQAQAWLQGLLPNHRVLTRTQSNQQSVAETRLSAGSYGSGSNPDLSSLDSAKNATAGSVQEEGVESVDFGWLLVVPNEEVPSEDVPSEDGGFQINIM